MEDKVLEEFDHFIESLSEAQWQQIDSECTGAYRIFDRTVTADEDVIS